MTGSGYRLVPGSLGFCLTGGTLYRLGSGASGQGFWSPRPLGGHNWLRGPTGTRDASADVTFRRTVCPELRDAVLQGPETLLELRHPVAEIRDLVGRHWSSRSSLVSELADGLNCPDHASVR
jgi:hypothetical protein